MNATNLMHELYGMGVMLIARGEELQLDAPKGILTPEITSALKQEKQNILRILKRPVDWIYFRERFHERAGIIEYDALLPREQAEKQAMIETYLEYLNQHPPILPQQFAKMIEGKGGLH